MANGAFLRNLMFQKKKKIKSPFAKLRLRDFSIINRRRVLASLRPPSMEIQPNIFDQVQYDIVSEDRANLLLQIHVGLTERD